MIDKNTIKMFIEKELDKLKEKNEKLKRRLDMKKVLMTILVLLQTGFVFAEYELTPTIVWGSYSSRTAKVQPNPKDYEILAGIQNRNYILDGGFERENGDNFNLAKINVRFKEWRNCLLESEYLLKEAYNIDSQSLKVLYKPFKSMLLLDPLSFGISLNYIKWASPKGLLNANYRSKNFQFSFETNFQDRIILSYKAGFDIPHGKHLVTQMFRKFERNNDSQFDQNKVVIGLKIKKIKDKLKEKKKK